MKILLLNINSTKKIETLNKKVCIFSVKYHERKRIPYYVDFLFGT